MKIYIECKECESSGKDVDHGLYDAHVDIGEVSVNEGINEVRDDGVWEVGVDHGACDVHVDEVDADSEVGVSYEAPTKV